MAIEIIAPINRIAITIRTSSVMRFIEMLAEIDYR